MANRKISEFIDIPGAGIDEEDLLTLVHLAEVDPALRNKKITFTEFKNYLNAYYPNGAGGTFSGNVLINANLNVTGQSTFQSVTVSGLSVFSGIVVQNNATVSGTISGNTVTGNTLQFGTSTTVTGTFTALATGVTAAFTTGIFTTLSGTTINAVTVSSTTGSFNTITGTTITGTTVNGTTVNATTGTFTSLTGTTTTGTTANFASGVFTTQISGSTVTGTQSSFTSGNFVTLSGNAVQGSTGTFTSGVFASGTAAAPSLSIISDPNTGIYSPGADQLAVATNGAGRLFVGSAGDVGIGIGVPTAQLHVVNVGATDSFIVEDSGSDATPFRIGAGGEVFTGSRLVVGSQEVYSDGTGGVGITQINGVGTNNSRIFSHIHWGAGPRFRHCSTPSTTLGTHTMAALSNVVGAHEFYASDGVSFIPSASIQSTVDATPSVGVVPGNLTFSTAPAGTLTERLRITSAGLVGIGTTSPGSALEINAAAATSPFIAKINTSEAARIDSSGKLLVGTSSARQSRLGTGSFQTQFQLESEDATTGLATSRFNDAAGSSFVNLQKGRGTIASPAAVIANDITGTILFSGWDGAAFTNSAFIRSEVDGTPGATDMPGRLVFATTADGGTTPTERMRIRNDGNIGIGAGGSASVTFYNQGPITGSTTAYANFTNATIQSDVTTSAYVYRTQLTTAAAAFTVANAFHYVARQVTLGAGSAITNQHGFQAEFTLTGATNNYGFNGGLNSATGCWNFYGAGTAPNYFAGDVRTNKVVTKRQAPTNSNTTATVATAASLIDGLRTSTPTASITLLVPTGTSMDAAFQELQNNQSFEWSLINLATAASGFDVTVTANTDHTVVGRMVVTGETSGRFLTRKTAANTFITYRIA